MLLLHQLTRHLFGRRLLKLQTLLYFFPLKAAAQPKIANLNEPFQLLHATSVLLERGGRWVSCLNRHSNACSFAGSEKGKAMMSSSPGCLVSLQYRR